MSYYMNLNNQEKIADILDNHLIGSERRIAYLYIMALRKNERAAIIDFESYGVDSHHIISNYHAHEAQKKIGYPVLAFNECGWNLNLVWINSWTTVLYHPKKKRYANNYFEVVETPNGMFGYSCHYGEGDCGGGWSPHEFCDFFSTKKEANEKACEFILNWHKERKSSLTEIINEAIRSLCPTPKQLELFA